MNVKWQNRFYFIACEVATWSKDPSTKVGAVIVDECRRIVSTGYNGLPRGVKDTPGRLQNRETKLRCTIHAEENAILFAPREVSGYSLVSTHHPCASCAAKIIQAGIVRVFYASHPEMERRWADDIELAKEMFSDASIMSLAIRS